jgi:hypothetical protein
MTPNFAAASALRADPGPFPQRVRDFSEVRTIHPSLDHFTVINIHHASTEESKGQRSLDSPPRHTAEDAARLWTYAGAR